MAEALIDDPVYVAVSTDVSESRLTLTWALRHLQPKKLYLLHVLVQKQDKISSQVESITEDKDKNRITKNLAI